MYHGNDGRYVVVCESGHVNGENDGRVRVVVDHWNGGRVMVVVHGNGCRVRVVVDHWNGGRVVVVVHGNGCRVRVVANHGRVVVVYGWCRVNHGYDVVVLYQGVVVVGNEDQ